MRVTWIAILAVAAAAGVRADDCCVEGQVKPWKLYGAGIRWHNPPRGNGTSDRSDPLKLARSPSWDDAYRSALERARTEKKLVLYFQLVGELDLEGC